MNLVINESGSIYDDEKKINGQEYMNPETGEMLDHEEHNRHNASEYLKRCSVNYSDDNEKNMRLNFEDINL